MQYLGHGELLSTVAVFRMLRLVRTECVFLVRQNHGSSANPEAMRFSQQGPSTASQFLQNRILRVTRVLRRTGGFRELQKLIRIWVILEQVWQVYDNSCSTNCNKCMSRNGHVQPRHAVDVLEDIVLVLRILLCDDDCLGPLDCRAGRPSDGNR